MPVGVTAEQDYGELELRKKGRLQNAWLPFRAAAGRFLLKQVIAADPAQPSPAAVVNAAAYLALVRQRAVAEIRRLGSGRPLLGQDRILLSSKNKTAVVDVRPYLIRLAAQKTPDCRSWT